MTLKEVANYTKSFFPQWDDETYNKLTLRLKLLDKQKISTLSCGQRSQVALALLLAQRAELLILDDFSMGLDPGYRRLFVITSYSIHYTKLYESKVIISHFSIYRACNHEKPLCLYPFIVFVITSYSIHYTKLYDWYICQGKVAQ